MSRHLLIMRHAKSNWDTDALTDFERPLSKRGNQNAPRMGTWMSTQGLKPGQVISSPATRAKQTASLVCKALNIPKSEIIWDHRIYEASLNDLLTVLKEQPQNVNRILMVGHNPGMAELVSYLWGDDIQVPPDGNLMPTATLAHLSMPEDWAALEYGCAHLNSLTRPKEIKAIE